MVDTIYIQEVSMKRVPIILSSIRKPILLEDDTWYPVYGFELAYDINIKGEIRSRYTGQLVKDYNGIVALRNPRSIRADGNALLISVVDIWSASILKDVNLKDLYSYFK